MTPHHSSRSSTLSRILLACLIGGGVCLAYQGVTHEVSATPAPEQGSTTVAEEMKDIYAAYRELQPLLTSEHRFSDPKSASKIDALLTALRNSFHETDKVDARFARQPGFGFTLSTASKLLDDSINRFREGKVSYAYWRLRSLSQTCITCHTTYNVEVRVQDEHALVSKLSSYDRGEFYLASRQFRKAEQAFRDALRQTDAKHRHIEALRMWLLIQTRLESSPNRALAQLVELEPDAVLAVEEREEVDRWRRSLAQWAAEGETPTTVGGLERLITRATAMNPLWGSADEVTLLRATAGLHKILGGRVLEGRERVRALYLLGFAYSRLQKFFLEDLSEGYLRQVIDEFPGSDDAKQAYALLYDHVTSDFTGSGGTQIPAELQLELRMLRDKAFGVPRFEERI